MEIKHTYSLASFSSYDQLSKDISLDDDQLSSNRELIEQEIESLQSIMNSQECEILSKSEALTYEKPDQINMVNTVLKLSLIPNCSKKFSIVDAPKDIHVELRCLPAIEVIIVIPDIYPSHGRPLLLLATQFYEPFKNILYENLNEKWYETLVLYEYVCFIQDELLNSYFDSDCKIQLQVNDKGNVEIKYNSSAEFQKIFDETVKA